MTRKERINQHIGNLLKIFPEARVKDPALLYRELRAVEKRLHKLAEDDCNVGVTAKRRERVHAAAKHRLVELFNIHEDHDAYEALYLNGDPRGYALKMDEPWTRDRRNSGYPLSTDWGGYGILAPDLR